MGGSWRTSPRTELRINKAQAGKTTLARIIANTTKSRFKELSATSHGVNDVKKVSEEAAKELRLTGGKTIIFMDEIHRFTKAQQDVFLPFVEKGTITLYYIFESGN
jgi:putative ATPase